MVVDTPAETDRLQAAHENATTNVVNGSAPARRQSQHERTRHTHAHAHAHARKTVRPTDIPNPCWPTICISTSTRSCTAAAQRIDRRECSVTRRIGVRSSIVVRATGLCCCLITWVFGILVVAATATRRRPFVSGNWQ